MISDEHTKEGFPKIHEVVWLALVAYLMSCSPMGSLGRCTRRHDICILVEGADYLREVLTPEPSLPGSEAQHPRK